MITECFELDPFDNFKNYFAVTVDTDSNTIELFSINQNTNIDCLFEFN